MFLKFKYFIKENYAYCIPTCWVLLRNPFVTNVLFLYPLKISENRKVFGCFQGVQKGWIGYKWVKRPYLFRLSSINFAFSILEYFVSLTLTFSQENCIFSTCETVSSWKVSQISKKVDTNKYLHWLKKLIWLNAENISSLRILKTVKQL